jgi:hypothetical protein
MNHNRANARWITHPSAESLVAGSDTLYDTHIGKAYLIGGKSVGVGEKTRTLPIGFLID